MSTPVETTADPVAAAPSPAGNSLGRLTALTLFTPVRRRWMAVERFGLWVGKHLPLAQQHIHQFEFIHSVRWMLVRKLPQNGPSQERDKLNYTYMLFESDFDGPWRNYIDAFAYVIPLDIRYVWGRGVEFPGPPPAEPLKKWIARNSMEGGHFYAAYPGASTKMVTGALKVHERLQKLAAESADLPPEQFRAAYQRFLTDVQVHL